MTPLVKTRTQILRPVSTPTGDRRFADQYGTRGY
jgi:hypothetical protein